MKLRFPDVFNSKKVALLEKQVGDLKKAVDAQRGYMRGLATEAPLWPGMALSRPDARLTYATLNKCYKQSSSVRPAVDGIIREVTTLPYTIEGFLGRKFDKGHKKAIEDFLYNPNRNKETFRDILAKALTDILIYDAGVIEKVKSPSGKLVELMPRDGSTFVPVGDKHGVLQRYEQHVSGTEVTFKKDEVIYMMLYPRAGTLWGHPIIESIVDEIATLLFSTDFIAKSFTEDEIPPGVLSLGEIGKEAYEAAQEDFKVKKGQKKDFKLRIVYGTKDVDWISFKHPAKEIQLNELRRSIERIIFRNFGVVPLEMGEVSDINRSFSADTQCLTRSGFKLISEVSKKEEVGTLNPETLEFEWQKNIRTYAYDFKGKMIHFKSRFVDCLVTPNHKMLVSRYRFWKEKESKWDELHFVDASDVPSNFGLVRCPTGFKGEKKEHFEIPSTSSRNGRGYGAKHGNVKVKMEDWMRFLGYYLSEGSLYVSKSDNKIKIGQKDREGVLRIRESLSKLPYNVLEGIKKSDGTTYFEINDKALAKCFIDLGVGSKSHEKAIPEEFKNLDQDYLKILLDALVDGDGWRGTNQPTWRREDQAGFYSTSSKRLADDVQEIAMKLGYEATIAKIGKVGPKVIMGRKTKCNHQSYQVYFRNAPYPYFNLVKSKHVKEVDYNGKVYCLEVPNHILITRRNARTCFNGNSTAMFQMRIAQTRLMIPIVNMITYYINKEIIRDEFKFDDVRYVIHLRMYEDEDEESRAMERLVRTGVKSINQVCAEKGWPPAKGGERKFIIVGKKLIFIDELEKMKGIVGEGNSSGGGGDGHKETERNARVLEDLKRRPGLERPAK